MQDNLFDQSKMKNKTAAHLKWKEKSWDQAHPFTLFVFPFAQFHTSVGSSCHHCHGLCLKQGGGVSPEGLWKLAWCWPRAASSERNVWCGISHCWHSGDGLPVPHHCATAAQTHYTHRNINASHSAPTLCTAVIGRGRRAHILIDANPDEPTDTLSQHPRPTRCTVGHH